MPSRVRCPNCEKLFAFKSEPSGGSVRCPACQTTFTAPGPTGSKPTRARGAEAAETCGSCRRTLAAGASECVCGWSRGEVVGTFAFADDAARGGDPGDGGSAAPAGAADEDADDRAAAVASQGHTLLRLREGAYFFPKVCCCCLTDRDLVVKKIGASATLYEPVYALLKVTSSHKYYGYGKGKVRGQQHCSLDVPICRACRKAVREGAKAFEKKLAEDNKFSNAMVLVVAGCIGLGGVLWAATGRGEAFVVGLILAVVVPLVLWFVWDPASPDGADDVGPAFPSISVDLVPQPGRAKNHGAWYLPHDVELELPEQYAKLFADRNRALVISVQ